MNKTTVALASALVFSVSICIGQKNPIITNMYTADPSAHVWADGRLYIYASHDIDPPRGCDLMDQYHVFSTDDMIHWKDHGEILRASQVPWGRKEGGFMWAPDRAYKKGVYYFYFPHPSEIDGEMKPMEGLQDFHEASCMHKRNGIYYLSYSDNHDSAGKHNQMRYATSKNPLGPWVYKGIYMEPTDSYTDHGSIVEYKGQWYFFYHTSAISHQDWLRYVCVDKLFFNEDGSIRKVVRTTGGIF